VAAAPVKCIQVERSKSVKKLAMVDGYFPIERSTPSHMNRGDPVYSAIA
jgi:hypothetical protein